MPGKKHPQPKCLTPDQAAALREAVVNTKPTEWFTEDSCRLLSPIR